MKKKMIFFSICERFFSILVMDEDGEAINSFYLTSVGVASMEYDTGGGGGGYNNSSIAGNSTPRVDLMNHPAVQVHIYAHLVHLALNYYFADRKDKC